MSKNCAIYTRVSIDNQAEKEFSSCDAQEQKIKSFIASQDSWQIFKVYSDAGCSGATTERPALQQLLSDLKKEKIDIVFVHKIDRLTRCPALNNELVHFSAEGFNHLIYKGKRRERNKNEQIMKFKLLPKAKTIIEITTTHQEYDESLIEIRKKKFKKIVQETAMVRYWGFVAIIRGFRTKVIVRQIGNGQKHFWSVIPAWITNQYRDIKLISKTRGDLAGD